MIKKILIVLMMLILVPVAMAGTCTPRNIEPVPANGTILMLYPSLGFTTGLGDSSDPNCSNKGWKYTLYSPDTAKLGDWVEVLVTIGQSPVGGYDILFDDTFIGVTYGGQIDNGAITSMGFGFTASAIGTHTISVRDPVYKVIRVSRTINILLYRCIKL